MKKAIVMPDSFKGTMTSMEVCDIMRRIILEQFPNCEVIGVPVADGGEGTVDCFLHALKGEKVYLPVCGAFFQEIEGFYGIIGDAAVIEMAAASGLVGNRENLNPLTASTYGVGQLIDDALKRGCKKIILGLGGSCTNDAGAGMAAALGAKFYDEAGNEFIPAGGTLAKVKMIDLSEIRKKTSGVKIEAMCDIDNLMFGENGAAYVFAPQKGADEDMVKCLDENLKRFAEIIRKNLGIDVSEMPGGGAAGATGAGAYSFLDAELKQGIDVVLDLINFETMMEKCDCIFTGEGKLDDQSLHGKVVVGIGKRAKEKNVPVIAVCGCIEGNISEIYQLGVHEAYAINRNNRLSLDELKISCKKDLELAMTRILNSNA